MARNDYSEYNANWRKTHKDHIKENNKRFRDSFNGKVTAIFHNSKRGLLTESKLSKEEIISLLKQSDWKCYYCNKIISEKTFSIDHKIPKMNGGANALNNIVLCCKHCNNQKNLRSAKELKKEIEVSKLKCNNCKGKDCKLSIRKAREKVSFNQLKTLEIGFEYCHDNKPKIDAPRNTLHYRKRIKCDCGCNKPEPILEKKDGRKE